MGTLLFSRHYVEPRKQAHSLQLDFDELSGVAAGIFNLVAFYLALGRGKHGVDGPAQR